ncbi:ribosomal protein S5 domain 2-type protein [Mycena amicta]|nr:ribosomal protein S5 domain 2-type protein [Mycena amicta]
MLPTVVSSPGKALIAGGYLVLDRAYSGLVVSTSSRFYTVVQKSNPEEPFISVRSPQFLGATWRYTVKLEPFISVEELPTNESTNKFIQLALQNTLSLASEIKGSGHVQTMLSCGIDVYIVGDNDFYSQRAQLSSRQLPRTLASLGKIPPFVYTGVPISEVHKTGLGSSAALITSLVSSLLLHLSVISSSDLESLDTDGRRLAHNLSQFVHCLAQGKVGSGFDVSAAVFGSHIYTRFDPLVLQTLMADDAPKSQSLLPIISPANAAWNYRIDNFQLPPLTRMMLADVDAGSDTPSLVGKVLKWRKDDSTTANALWTTLNQLNQSLAQHIANLTGLHKQHPDTYKQCVEALSTARAREWQPNFIASAFIDVHQTSQVCLSTVRISLTSIYTQAIRERMREMGTLSGVPIEPVEQTELLDLCITQPGVIAGGVPGAGGYDALWLLVCDPESEQPVHVIEKVWATYTKLDVSPLSAVESRAKGARVERVDNIPGLQAAVSR